MKKNLSHTTHRAREVSLRCAIRRRSQPYIFLSLVSIAIFLISCGGSKTTQENPEITFDESDYTPALTEEQQIKESESDKEYYKRAKAEGNPALCEKINFTDLKKLCLEKAKEKPAEVVDDDTKDVIDDDSVNEEE